MKALAIAALALVTIAGGARAQSSTNSTIAGGQTAPSNSAGAPSAAAPTGALPGGSNGSKTAQLPGDTAAGQPTTSNSGSPVATTAK